MSDQATPVFDEDFDKEPEQGAEAQVDLGAEGDLNEYAVRLLFRFKAPSARDAVRMMISQLVEFGLLDWAYRVVNLDTDETTVTDGRGETIPTPEDEDAEGS